LRCDPEFQRLSHREGLGTRTGTRIRLGSELQRAAQKKLRLLNAASELASLRVPPGNRLEKLSGDRAGQYSIRINDQYRICFTWTDGGADDVEITDYH
jgi:proteic killer suppression protein